MKTFLEADFKWRGIRVLKIGGYYNTKERSCEPIISVHAFPYQV